MNLTITHSLMTSTVLEQQAPLNLASFKHAYAYCSDPKDVLREIYHRIDIAGTHPVWISLLPLNVALDMLEQAMARKARGEELPLFGIPFGVKDNIDVFGLPTTAGCPEFSYMPQSHAFVVEQLIAAGAIPIEKTNLDQFATGLNGTRSPYGIPTCVFDERYISGGSSSGSAVAVGSGFVPFSLGTDTAGSGRVPAAFNNLVGIKPTKGTISTRGLVPAARSLDCISIFAHSVDDALTVARIASAYDAADSFSRQVQSSTWTERKWPARFTFGVPSASQLKFFDDMQAEGLFEEAIRKLEKMGGQCVRFDYTPFQETAELLYSGPWVAERLAAIQSFTDEHPGAIHPVVRDIILSAQDMSAADAFRGSYRLSELNRRTQALWQQIDVMLLPTAPTIYTVEDMLTDPVCLNSNLGFYTNFVNLMDLSAIAVPAGFRPDGLPFGITFIGQAFEDGTIASLGKAFMARDREESPWEALQESAIRIAVVGAHLSGQPLNHQLTGRGGTLHATTKTSAGYALYAINDSNPPKPGLLRDRNAAGYIEVEIWELSATAFGYFVAEIPPPLGIGTLTLEDGSQAKGFVCEPYAIEHATDITHYGGWRAYLADQ